MPFKRHIFCKRVNHKSIISIAFPDIIEKNIKNHPIVAQKIIFKHSPQTIKYNKLI